MSLIPPKRLFHILSMSTVMYKDNADDIKEKGYVAVSHVWGDQQMYSADMFGIVGVDWDIPLSSPNKISRLASAMMEYDMEYCWFDVLCMPQNKQDEINLEIPFMGDYYSGADITLVLSDINYTISDDYKTWCDMISDAMETQRELTFDENAWIASREKYSLLDISEERWFTRVWTLQEAVLSKKIILVDFNGFDVNLSEVFDKLAYMASKNVFHAISLFGESRLELLGLSYAILSYKNKILNLSRILSTNARRSCYKVHDRFYGILGILGYKDFVVDYGKNIRNLNRDIAQYACSRGDINWMAIAGDLGTSFIQPMYIEAPHIGSEWQENSPGICNITFGHNTLHMKAMTLATITCCENFANSDLRSGDFIGWAVRIFRNWGFDDTLILHTIVGYIYMSDEIIQMGLKFINWQSMGHDISEIMELIGRDDDMQKYSDVMAKIGLISRISNTITIVKANVPMIKGNRPFIISGSVDTGDKIVTPKISDGGGRNLGIVSDTFRRKGVCLIPRLNMDRTHGVCHEAEIPDYLYILHKFLL